MIYKTKVFTSLTKKSGITDDDLCRACWEVEQGLVDADLGGHVYKKRIALRQGKRAGYRTLVAAIIGQRYFFLYGFAKQDKANINAKEQLALKELAGALLALEPDELNRLVSLGELIEVTST